MHNTYFLKLRLSSLEVLTFAQEHQKHRKHFTFCKFCRPFIASRQKRFPRNTLPLEVQCSQCFQHSWRFQKLTYPFLHKTQAKMSTSETLPFCKPFQYFVSVFGKFIQRICTHNYHNNPPYLFMFIVRKDITLLFVIYALQD